MSEPVLNQARILEKIKVAQKQALTGAADVLIADIQGLIPKWRSKLQKDIKTQSVVLHGNDAVLVIQSEKGTISHNYAATQYYGKLRHAGSPEEKEPLTQFDSKKLGAGERRKTKKSYAHGDKAIYSRSYHRARKLRLIKKMKAPRWFERGIRDKKILLKMLNTYRKFWKFAAK